MGGQTEGQKDGRTDGQTSKFFKLTATQTATQRNIRIFFFFFSFLPLFYFIFFFLLSLFFLSTEWRRRASESVAAGTREQSCYRVKALKGFTRRAHLALLPPPRATFFSLRAHLGSLNHFCTHAGSFPDSRFIQLKSRRGSPRRTNTSKYLQKRHSVARTLTPLSKLSHHNRFLRRLRAHAHTQHQNIARMTQPRAQLHTPPC